MQTTTSTSLLPGTSVEIVRPVTRPTRLRMALLDFDGTLSLIRAGWQHVCRPVPDTGQGGNPPALVLLQDGRLCLTYGYRAAPYGIRARLSRDDGNSWGKEIILRDDGGSYDLGYTRTLQRPDGTLVTVYYYNDTPGGAAYIAATLWRP